MTTTATPFPLINLDAIRATLLDSCGLPVWGDAAYIVSEGLVSVAVTSNWDEGNEIMLKNGKGRREIERAAEEELINLLVTINFTKVNPLMYTLLTGYPPIVNAKGETVGYHINRGVRPVDSHVMLEGWQDAYDDAGCVNDDASLPFGYHLWPHLRGGRFSDFTLENNVVTFSVTSMRSQDAGDLGVGPYMVADDESGAAQALYDAVDARDHQISFKTLIAPPSIFDAMLPLDNPDDPDATTATAGTPGTWNGVRSADLVALRASSITGSGGASAWTTGQYVILGDGSLAHWAGSGASPKWVAGKA